MYLIFGGLLVTGSANGFNQILERDYDKIMTRTAKRPLPLKNLKLSEAVFFSMIIGFIGLYLLNFIKPEGSYFGYLSKSSLFGLISMLLYVFSYTPLKRLSTISIFVGAIPGAIPFLLGWVALLIILINCWNFICDSIFLAIPSFYFNCMGSG